MDGCPTLTRRWAGPGRWGRATVLNAEDHLSVAFIDRDNDDDIERKTHGVKMKLTHTRSAVVLPSETAFN